MGRRFRQRWQGEGSPPGDEDGHSPYGTCRVQVVRSVSDWSHGVLTEDSVQNACTFALFCLSTVLIFVRRLKDDRGGQSLYLYREPVLVSGNCTQRGTLLIRRQYFKYWFQWPSQEPNCQGPG